MKKQIMMMGAVFAWAGTATSATTVKTDARSVTLETPTLAVRMTQARNYCPTLEGVGAEDRFGLLVQTKIWYHGRTGNARRFYQDQDEFSWPTESRETTETEAIFKTGTVDYDVRREISAVEADPEAVRLDYLLTTKETRFYDPVDFPLMYFTKEIESVSFDDGRLENFRTLSSPGAADLIRSRAFLLHLPKRDKTLLLLVDVNRPLSLGRTLGVTVRQSVNGWSRVFNFRQLWHEELPFMNRGERIGFTAWFKLLDGGARTPEQVAAVRALAGKVGARDTAFGPSALDEMFERPSKLATSLPASDALTLWTETPMKRVYPGTRVPETRAEAVHLESASNERESFQLVLCPDRATTLGAAVSSDLLAENGARIPAANVSVSRLGYETVAETKALVSGETRFADRMIPLSAEVTLPPKENTILHVTVFTPAGTPGGRYRGTVTLSVGGSAERVPVELKVWDVELPRETAYIGHMLVWCSPFARREQVLRRFSECGMMGTIYNGGGAPKLKACFDGKTLKLPDGFALAEKSVREMGAPYFQIPWAFMGAWNWNTNKTVFLGLDLKIDSPEFDENFRNYLVSTHAQLAARGIVDRSFLYMWDEMTEGHYPAMRKTTDMVRRHAPGVKILTVSAPDPEVLANNDIIVAGHPAHWWSAEARDVVRRANGAGKKIWMYANSVTFGTASRSLIPRLTPWLCRSHGMCGYLHWSCDYNWKANDFAKNGKEWLLYPSEGEPVYSVRMEYFRDGVEDFDLLQLLRKLPEDVRAGLERKIAEISSDHSALDMDPVHLAAVRRLVAETLEKHAR